MLGIAEPTKLFSLKNRNEFTNDLPRCKHPRYQIPKKNKFQIPKKIKFDTSIGELNPIRLNFVHGKPIF
jgi:hypothetical protein